MENYGLVHDSADLRKLMQEHPGCPIVVLANEESACLYYAWTYCSRVRCAMSQILDIVTPYDNEENVFTDREEFRDAIAEAIDAAHPCYTDRELDEAVEAEYKKYEEYWRDVIAIYASN